MTRPGRSLAVPDHQDRFRSSIGRGENSGHTLTYTNVVRRWVKLGDWTGKAETFTVPIKDVQSGDIDRSRCWCRAASPARPS